MHYNWEVTFCHTTAEVVSVLQRIHYVEMLHRKVMTICFNSFSWNRIQLNALSEELLVQDNFSVITRHIRQRRYGDWTVDSYTVAVPIK